MYESGWAVSPQSRHLDLAAELAVFLSSPAANRRRLEQGLAIPANISLAKEAVERDETGLESVFYDAIGQARAPLGARLQHFAVIEKAAQQAFEEALIGGRPLAAALAEAAARIDRRRAAAPEGAPGRRPDLWLFLAAAVGLGLIAIAWCWLSERRAQKREARNAWLMLAPATVHLTVFAFTPLLFSLYLALHHWSIIGGETSFVGLGNFAEAFDSRIFWIALKNTALYSLHVPAAMAIALCLAVLLNRPGAGAPVLRALFFLPSISSFVALAMVWKWLYNAEYGLLNAALGRLGIGPVGWLTDPADSLIPLFPTPLLAIMAMSVWMSVGYQMVIFHAGLQGIPQHLYEAAVVDGASAWRRFRHITVPMLRPTTLFVLVTSMIASFQVFTAIYVMTEGGPLQSTNVIVFEIYDQAWNQLRMGYASAMAWVLLGILLAVTWLQFRFLGREMSYT